MGDPDENPENQACVWPVCDGKEKPAGLAPGVGPNAGSVCDC